MTLRAHRYLHLAIGLAILPLAVFALFAVFAPGEAWARPGGGHSYSGGSRSSGGHGGGGGDDGGALFAILWLCFRHPVIGIPVLILIVVFLVGRGLVRSKMQNWSTGGDPSRVARVESIDPEPSAGVPRAELDAIRTVDPDFSIALFEDFVYLLYAELHRARAGKVEGLAAFVAPGIVQNLHSDPNLAEVRGIVIGAMRVVGFSGAAGPAIEITLEFEANYVEAYHQGGERRFYVTDSMTLRRAGSARSRPAGRARTLDCPNCGAPLQNIRGTQCTYCQKDVGGGRFDWNVVQLSTLGKELRGPLLTSDVPETGTNDPTLVDPGAASRLRELAQRDPSFDWSAFQQRTAHIFFALQGAWSARDPSRIRPYVSDNLFQSMMYWIDLYLQSKCANINENARILRMDLANVLSDKVYDAITVRVFATGLDYTVSDDGKLLSGSRSRARTYSEYYTLIRGSQRKGRSRADTNCPNCGAPLQISMVGNCEHCRAKVTAGEFDWVLSRIEQDESYTG